MDEADGQHLSGHRFFRVSPAYDLTYSEGPGGEHSAAIAGEGRNPGKQHLLAVAKGASITEGNATEIIEQVRAVVDHWPRFADEAGLGKVRTDEVDRKLNGARRPQSANRVRTDSVSSYPEPQPTPRKKPSDDNGYNPSGSSCFKT
jgi:serine/threonine-protein kinase HipA